MLGGKMSPWTWRSGLRRLLRRGGFAVFRALLLLVACKRARDSYRTGSFLLRVARNFIRVFARSGLAVLRTTE